MLALVYSGVALACLMWPEHLQRLALKHCGTPGKLRVFVSMVRSPRYVVFLQLVGAISGSAAVSLTLFLLRNVRYGS